MSSLRLLRLLIIFIVPAVCRKTYKNQSKKEFKHSVLESDTLLDATNGENEEIDDDWMNSYNEISDISLRHLTKRDIDYSTGRYFKSCGRNIFMRKNLKVRITSPFQGKKQYPEGKLCEWNFLGGPECVSQIVCETIDLRSEANKDCLDEHLTILDGVKGYMKLCDESSSFTTPKKSAAGHDLFVIFETAKSREFSRLYKGFKCEVTCAKSNNVEPLPGNLKRLLIKEEALCECGKPNGSRKRIVGGKTTTPFEYPWQVGIARKGTRLIHCGGTLINSLHVLTAAHCFSSAHTPINIPLDEVLIHVHDTSKSDSAENTLRVSISKIVCHPFYGLTKWYDFDACVLKLDREINIVEYNTLCLPPPNLRRSTLIGKRSHVSGWGKLSHDGEHARYLQEVEVPIILSQQCVEEYGEVDISSARMICAGYPMGGMDACGGDSGGPLSDRYNTMGGVTRWQQIGIVSFGEKCALAGKSGVYTFVPAIVPWITRTAMEGKWCKKVH